MNRRVRGEARAIWPLSWMGEALGASRSGRNAWPDRLPSKRAREHAVLRDGIRASFAGSDRTLPIEQPSC
jgi:hypothetical protein